MITFPRYPHIKEIFLFYAEQENRKDIINLLSSEVNTKEEAEMLCRFAWKVAGHINMDEQNGTEVLGSNDNTDMLPDLAYEMTAYMKSVGCYEVWQRVSDEEMDE